jgi:hypothetical protein
LVTDIATNIRRWPQETNKRVWAVFPKKRFAEDISDYKTTKKCRDSW